MGRWKEQSTIRMATALVVACVAVVSATSLHLLRTVNQRATRRIAALSFLQTGKALTAALAETCLSPQAVDDVEIWRKLGWFFDTLSAADPAIESLSVERNGLTLFRRQASLNRVGWGGHPPDPTRFAREDVLAEHAVHNVAGRSLPVVVFTTHAGDDSGEVLTLQLGLRQDSLVKDETLAGESIRSMYRVALATQGVALVVMLGFMLWLDSRERKRERRRRTEEHLAFAGVLANGIVHDFRNPMSAIRLDAQMLEREALKEPPNPGRMAELAVRMRTTLDRIESVFQEFFFLSEPSRTKAEPLDLSSGIRECVGILQPRIEEAELEIVFSLPEEPLSVVAHAAPLRRALLNVLSNAIAFAPRGSTLEIQASRQRSQVILDVLDPGPGIPETERERIFEMFVTSRPGGTGLGLFLARTALEISGGRIEARGREEGGTCIRILLPSTPQKESRES